MLKKEGFIWAVFIILMITVSACSNGNDNGSYDKSAIQKRLNNLNPDNEKDAEILHGREIFNHTDTAVPDHTGNKLTCISCHGDDGLDANSPMVGMNATYPKMHQGKYTTLADRVNGCMIRSMNGTEFDKDDKELHDVVAFLDYVSKDVRSKKDITWRMTNQMKKTPEPDVTRGAELFEQKNCIACHATDGSGSGNETGPALWGEDSFNDAAGMARFSKAAGYIQNNMPRGLEGTLTDQEASDLAAFMLSHERPVADKTKVGTRNLDPKRDYITKDRRKKIRDKTFDWKSLDSVKENEE